MADMTKEQAQSILYEQVYIPSFVNKLAELNIPPQSKADLVEMLKIAENLDLAERNGIVSRIESEEGADSFLKQASHSLEAALRVKQDDSPQVSQEALAAASVLAGEREEAPAQQAADNA